MSALVAAGATTLAVLHVIGGHLRFLTYIPRSGWLSFAGGISVAYVFVHLLPELAEGAEVVAESAGESYLARHALWLVALAGLVIFYGLEIAARHSRRHSARADAPAKPLVYRASIVWYAAYNGVIAYLLHRRAEEGAAELALFVIAMSLHFLVNDFALREHHDERYETSGRWILAGAIAVGALAGGVTEISETVVALTLALIAGGVVLNVMKEELPSEAESSFTTFGAGVASYAGVLVAVGSG